VTLTQIIVEDAKGQPAGLPLELLRQLIVASDRVGQEFIMWYLKSAFDAYRNVQSSVQSRLNQVQTAALSPLQMVKSLLHTDGAEKSSDTKDEHEEVEQLRRRLAELEKQQVRPAPPKKPAEKPARKSTAARPAGKRKNP
jgi:polyhydroxyalkanoate synthesis regulator protein